MSDLAASLLAGVAVGAAVALAGMGRRRSEAAGMLARLGGVSTAAPGPAPDTHRRALLSGLADAVAGTSAGARLASYASRNHPSLSFSDFLAWGAAGVLGGGLAAWLVFGGGPLVIVGAAVSPLVLDRVKAALGGRRAARIEQQLPEAFTLQAASLRAGRSVGASLRLLAEQMGGPLGEEVSLVVREMQLGRSLEAALTGFAPRAGSRDVQLWATAMGVHRRTGGNLPGVLDSLAARIRERAQMRSEVRALTAQARLSGLVVALAPMAFFVLLSATSREQMQVLYSTRIGLAVLAAGLGLQAAGFVWIRRILRIKP